MEKTPIGIVGNGNMAKHFMNYLGMENIPFMWYFKKIGWLAAIGYFSGAIVYILTNLVL